MPSHQLLAPGLANHQHAIEMLANETKAPIDHVREIYETEHARLVESARVKTFVTVIAMRLVRNVLHAETDRAPQT